MRPGTGVRNRPQRAKRVLKGRLDARLHHRVHLHRQPGTGLEDLMRAELERLGTLALVATGREHFQPARAGQ